MADVRELQKLRIATSGRHKIQLCNAAEIWTIGNQSSVITQLLRTICE